MLFFGICLLCASCGEIIEENIANDKPNLTAPGPDAQTSIYNLQFYWEPLTGARTYHLQIAQPSFSQLNRLVIDTLVSINKFSFSLDPGSYEWRLRGENAGYMSNYAIRKFTIIPSSLNSQKIQLNSPAMGFVTSNEVIDFSWNTLFGANAYQLQVDTNNFSGNSNYVLDQQVEGSRYKLTLPKDQNYSWRVRALSDTSQSQWSETRTFLLDRRAPETVVLSSPADASVAPRPVALSWQSISDVDFYTLSVYKSDSTTPVNGFPKQVKGAASYSFDIGLSAEKYYWQVKATDKAGNTGANSVMRYFVIQ